MRKHLMHRMLTRRQSRLSRSKGFVTISSSNANYSLGFSGTLVHCMRTVYFVFWV